MNLDEDRSYISGLRKRDTRTYEVVFKKYYQPLVMFVVRHIGNEDVAKDIVQDIFFKLFESSSSLPDDFLLKSWFYRVARNAAVDYLRHLQVEDKYKFLMAEAMISIPDNMNEFGYLFFRNMKNKTEESTSSERISRNFLYPLDTCVRIVLIVIPNSSAIS